MPTKAKKAAAKAAKESQKLADAQARMAAAELEENGENVAGEADIEVLRQKEADRLAQQETDKSYETKVVKTQPETLTDIIRRHIDPDQVKVVGSKVVIHSVALSLNAQTAFQKELDCVGYTIHLSPAHPNTMTHLG